MKLSANESWFLFNVSDFNSGDLGVYAFSGNEALSQPYEFEIELVSRNGNLDLSDFLGKEALLTVFDRSGTERLIHGVIRQFDIGHIANVFTHYRCELVPRFWFLSQTQDHRIFQNLTVPEIIKTVLQKHKFVRDSYDFHLRSNYPIREYCVQYGESDLDFISRIAEEEGIYFYFEHNKNGHKLCFSDAEGGPRIPGESSIRYFEGSGAVADTAVVARLSHRHRIHSDGSTYREWNFTIPSADLTAHERETEWLKAPVPQAMSLETYQFPHLYGIQSEGDRYAKIQLLRHLTFREWIECQSDVSRFMPGHTFALHSHPREDTNGDWLLVSVRHVGSQPGVLEHEAPSERGLDYNCAFTAIPAATRFVPSLVHKKKKIEGIQSAIVTGPDGEEIYPDKFGRVKVQFHWDRFGQADEKTTCWIRVSQGWAGGQFGMMAIPRIGHEVVVSFMEGDPDRPLITGRVYHAANMPPYDLPQHKTRMTIKSKTHHGKGSNELRFEDLLSAEQVYLHAERDKDVIVEHDDKTWVRNDQHTLIGKDSVEEITGHFHSQVNDERVEATAKKKTTTVGEDEAHQVGGDFQFIAEKSAYWLGKTKGVIEMEQELTIKAPGGFIKIDQSGIAIVGKVVNINSGGSAGVGKPVQASTARSAQLADARDGLTGKAGTVLGKQKAPEAPDDKEAPQVAVAQFDRLGNQSFVTEAIQPIQADSILGALSATAMAALGALQSGPQDIAMLKLSDDDAAAEWGKTVAEARLEETAAGKIDVVDRFLNQNVRWDGAQGERIKGINDVIMTGQATDLERAIAEHQTLEAAGVPSESMRLLVTRDNAFVAVTDKEQVLIAGNNIVPNSACRSASSLPPSTTPVFGCDGLDIYSYSAA